MTQSTRSRIGNVVGRLVVVVPFWTVLAYAVGAVFGSILLDLYRPPPSHAASGGGERADLIRRAWCLGELHDLEAEIEKSARADLETREAERAARRHAWRTAYQDLARSCGNAPDADLRQAYAGLGAVQLQVAAARDRLARSRAEIAEGLRHAARSLNEN